MLIFSWKFSQDGKVQGRIDAFEEAFKVPSKCTNEEKSSWMIGTVRPGCGQRLFSIP